LHYGDTVKVYQGLDCCWSLSFEKEVKSSDEKSLLNQLESFRGALIKTPYELRAVADMLKNQPLIHKWIYQKIRVGYISEHAFKYLKKYIGEIKNA
jgi:hypothetical protein